MTPKPSPSFVTLKPRRRLYCRHYESCLDLAVSRRWLGWTCEHCQAYAPIELDMQTELDGCYRLLLALVLREHKIKHPSPARIDRARQLHQKGWSYAKIGAAMDISRATAYRWLNPTWSG